MKNLKIILFCSLIIFQIINIRHNIRNSSSKYNLDTNTIYGMVISKDISENKISFIVKGEENILVNDYDFISDVSLGDVVKIDGVIKEVKPNTNFNLFNYKNYLLSKKIHYTFELEEVVFIKNDNKLFFLKNKLINRLEHINNSYLNTFVLADNQIDEDIYQTYQNNGISHLFAVSGTHISLISVIMFFILHKIIKNKKVIYLIISFFLIFYMFLTGFTASVVRCSLVFIITSIFRLFNVRIKTISIALIVLNILLIYNPFYIYDIGFLYSFLISISLIIFKDNINNSKNYFTKLFMTSFVAFIISIPITVNNNFSINIMSPIINLFFVPFITFIIFPSSLITLIIPSFNFIFNYLLIIMEKISIFFNFLSINIICPYISISLIIIYYIFIYIILKKKNKVVLVTLSIGIILFLNKNYFNKTSSLTMLDVGQGDAFLIELDHNKGNILIDTGGNKNYDLSKNILIPYLKSRGIKKIDYLMLSHGDFDHMGASLNLIKNFKVNNVLMNSGSNNDLEKELINELKAKKINYQNINKNKLEIKGNYFYFLNILNIEDENRDSLIMYTKINNYNLLFMGDASCNEEEKLLNNYIINDIDILKIGHHGSSTSSCDKFISHIRPKYALISVGENNFYGHPSKKVIDLLVRNDIERYQTSIDGSVKFILGNKIKIYTCLVGR